MTQPLAESTGHEMSLTTPFHPDLKAPNTQFFTDVNFPVMPSQCLVIQPFAESTGHEMTVTTPPHHALKTPETQFQASVNFAVMPSHVLTMESFTAEKPLDRLFHTPWMPGNRLSRIQFHTPSAALLIAFQAPVTMLRNVSDFCHAMTKAAPSATSAMMMSEIGFAFIAAFNTHCAAAIVRAAAAAAI